MADRHEREEIEGREKEAGFQELELAEEILGKTLDQIKLGGDKFENVAGGINTATNNSNITVNQKQEDENQKRAAAIGILVTSSLSSSPSIAERIEDISNAIQDFWVHAHEFDDYLDKHQPLIDLANARADDIISSDEYVQLKNIGTLQQTLEELKEGREFKYHKESVEEAIEFAKENNCALYKDPKTGFEHLVFEGKDYEGNTSLYYMTKGVPTFLWGDDKDKLVEQMRTDGTKPVKYGSSEGNYLSNTLEESQQELYDLAITKLDQFIEQYNCAHASFKELLREEIGEGFPEVAISIELQKQYLSKKYNEIEQDIKDLREQEDLGQEEQDKLQELEAELGAMKGKLEAYDKILDHPAAYEMFLQQAEPMTSALLLANRAENPAIKKALEDTAHKQLAEILDEEQFEKLKNGEITAEDIDEIKENAKDLNPTQTLLLNGIIPEIEFSHKIHTALEGMENQTLQGEELESTKETLLAYVRVGFGSAENIQKIREAFEDDTEFTQNLDKALAESTEKAKETLRKQDSNSPHACRVSYAKEADPDDKNKSEVKLKATFDKEATDEETPPEQPTPPAAPKETIDKTSELRVDG